VEVEVEVDAPPTRQKSPAVPRSAIEKPKAAGAAPKAVRQAQENPREEEQRVAQKPQAPKPQLKKELSGTVGVVGRELEALARLMASF
jgi:hypothetical protein